MRIASFWYKKSADPMQCILGENTMLPAVMQFYFTPSALYKTLFKQASTEAAEKCVFGKK